MENYKSNKQEQADAKKRAGTYSVKQIQSVDHLPTPFKTDLNKKWLDATFDQMISKGDLENIDAFIGNSTGKALLDQNDSYLNSGDNSPQLEPAIVTYDDDGEVISAIAVDDIANSIAQNFDEYNYNAAYNSNAYVFAPPINIDKFVNFVSYYWANDLPVYESTYATGGDSNPTISLTGIPIGSFEDANNTVELREGMKIKFTGGYDAAIEDNTYMITGVGTSIQFRLIVDAVGRNYFTDITPYSNNVGGMWDENCFNTAITTAVEDPFDLIDAYNASVTRPPLFKFFIAEVNKNVYLTNDMILTFNDSWTWNAVDGELNEHRVFIVQIDEFTGDVTLDIVIDAHYNGPEIEQTVMPGYEELATDLGYPFESTWDSTKLPHPTKDYIVINRADGVGSAWSRANFWVHKDSIVYMATLMPSIDINEILTIANRAKRPIIEFDTCIRMMNHGCTAVEYPFKGQVDYLLGDADAPVDMSGTYYHTGTSIPADSYVVYMLTTDQHLHMHIYQVQSDGELIVVDDLSDGHTFVPLHDLTSYDDDHTAADMHVVDFTIERAQYKSTPNQPPLFMLRDKDGTELTNFEDSTFNGNKIFGYKEGTGTVDSELGFALSYKDTAAGANIVFENSLFETTYHYHRDFGHAPSVIPGYYFFDKDNKSTSTYIPSSYSFGAKNSIQVIPGLAQEVTIDVGYNQWRTDKEFVIYDRGGKVTASEILTEGVYNRVRVDQPTLILARNTTYEFHDLTPSQNLRFYDPVSGDDVETVIGHPVTIVRSGVNIYVTLPDELIYILEFGPDVLDGGDPTNRGRIVTNESQDELFHTVFVNGRKLAFSEYTVNADSIVIPEEVFDSDDIVIDVEYYYNDQDNPSNVQIPDTHKHNSQNHALTEFTIAETLDHWLEIIEHTPGFEGDAFGDNTYHKTVHVKTYGGNIFMKDDISIMHDLCYSIDEMNLASAINEQGRDWWAFKERVISQTRRLYKTKTYSSVKDLANDVINSVSMYKTKTGLYDNSNVVYTDPNSYTDIEYVIGTTRYHLDISINNDDFRKDHLYIYVTDNRDNDNVSVTRLLTLDVDYKMDGSWIEFINEPTPFTDSQKFNVRAYYHPMDEVCNISPSMTKLGLSHTYTPQVVDDELICHDGSTYTVNTNVELQKINDVNFDPVAAVLFDIETRVYNGIRKQDDHGVNSFVKYFPSQHRGTWYYATDIDNYIEKYFKDWYAQTNQTTLTPTDYFVDADPFTWNYSTLELPVGHMSARIPGHWKGAYMLIFGTATPHITPWHMLGFTDKPEWWDEYYSWTDPVKRDAMTNAFNLGIISHPDFAVEQDLYYARYYWDFTTQSPVDALGRLESPEIVLGTPTPVNRAQSFMFGDWGPVEWKWRNSALGQAAMLDAIVKLNPTKAWTDFFQTNVIGNQDNSNGMMLDKYTSQLIGNDTIYYDDVLYNDSMIKTIDVVSSEAGFPTDTQIHISGDFNTIQARAVLDYDDTGKIISVTLLSKGFNYVTMPTIELTSDSVPSLPQAEFLITMEHGRNYRNGINKIQTNSIERNQVDLNIATIYNRAETRLLQKLGGFTSSHLIKVESESGSNGKYQINHGDAPLVMYTSKPSDIYVACEIHITKNNTSYTINGLSNHKQQFKFHEPLTNNINDYVNIDLNEAATIKKFANFSDVVSILEYDTNLTRIQDVYNFIRGNYEYLNNVGYQFDNYGDVLALSFAQWATTADQDDRYVLPLPQTVKFETDSNVVLEYNTLPGKTNTILSSDKNIIDNSDLLITRDISEVTIETKTSDLIASIGTATVTHQHAILFENTTQFNEVIFDDVSNTRQYRMKLIGQRTRNWSGAKQAPGYLVKDNTIIQNFDSTIEEIANFYDFDIDKFNNQATKAENLMLNNVARDWVARLGLPSSVVSKFFKGVIKSKGTKNVVQRVGRSRLINEGNSDIDIYEEYMFKQGDFGDTTRTKSTEFMITPDQVSTDPSIVDFSNDDIIFVNNVNTPVFDTLPYADNETRLNTAGDLLDTDADSVIFTVDDFETLYDSSADYANIDTWNSKVSYKFGDKVRLEGRLWECNVNYIGYATEPSDLSFLGTITDPTFTHRNSVDHPTTPSAVIDGTSIWFDKTETVYDSIIASTTVNPTVQSPSNLIIDGNTVDLVQQELTTIVDTNAEHNGNPFALTVSNPSSLDVTGMELLINGTTVNLETYATYNPTLMTYEMIRSQLMAAISSVSNVTAYDYEGDATKVAIVYDVAGDPNLSLVIGAASGNAEFGIIAGTYNPTTTQVLQHQMMDIDYIASQINLTGYDVSVVSQVMYIEKLPTTEFTQFTTMEISGLAQAQLGLPTSTSVSSNVVNINSDAQDVADYINAAGISGVSASVISGRVNIESTNTQIDLGDNEFNTEAGIETGIFYSTNEDIGNTFDSLQWNDITFEDTALFNIWIADDSELIVSSHNGTISSKFFDWNVLQVQQFPVPYYATSIVAGTETDDGNDAQVTLNIERNVKVGDYIMLVNTTTTPSIDGIHRVTKLGNAGQPNTFYINMFIQEDGAAAAAFILRAARFERVDDILASATDAVHYNWNNGDLVWASEKDSIAGTYVYEYQDGFNELTNRTKTERVTNSSIENVIVYNGDTQTTVTELEVFDPLRGIIPGVADRELDIKNSVDFAVYNTTTDIDYDVDEHNAWGEAEVGRTWWDISKIKYYDYDQGDNEYKAKMWSRQFPTSSIDVYEWTKSTVTPDEWKNAVDNGTIIFDTEATGTAYSVYDKTLNEDLYYYVTHETWNEILSDYETVYYFWVKNKTTTQDDRVLSVKAIADIIDNPTAQGIQWCAAIDDNVMIVNNIKHSVNDINSVVQINLKPTYAAHNNWTTIRENKDLIPEYWYIGLRDNLMEMQKSSGLILPNDDLHEYNRYGDDRALSFNNKTYSQSWFRDPWNARREAIEAINSMLRGMNLLQDLDGKWNRTLSETFYDIPETAVSGIESDPAVAIPSPNLGDAYYDTINNLLYFYNQDGWNQAPGMNMTTVWNYADYVSTDRNPLKQPSIEVASYDELMAIDPTEHDLVKVVIEGNIDRLDKSEIFLYDPVKQAWSIVEKANGTIQFNDFVYNNFLFNGWDGAAGWDGYWDMNPADYMEYIIYACRHDLFIEEYINNFNKLFFAIVKYAASEHEQIDWVYKTTYVHMNIVTDVATDDDKLRKYTRSSTSELQGYVNTVKPFHTKIKSVLDTYKLRDDLNVSLSEDRVTKIKMRTTDYLNPVDYDHNVTVVNTGFDTTTTDVVEAGTFSTAADDVLNSLSFITPTNWNTTHEEYRRSNVAPAFNEQLSIKVITNTTGNTVDANTRTYAYIQDNHLNTSAFSLQENKASTLAVEMEYTDDEISLAATTGSLFSATGGYAFVNGEIVKYTQSINDTLKNVTRGEFGTIAQRHDISTQIVDITGDQLDMFKTLNTLYENNLYGTSTHFDVITGKEMLDVTAEDITSQELQASGKGIS